MDTLIVKENGKELRLSIEGYEFDETYVQNNKSYDYDDNWLNVRVDYIKDDHAVTYYSPCLEASDLAFIVRDIDTIIGGGEKGFIQDFLEPNLLIAVTKVRDVYAVGISFTSDSDWKTIFVSQVMNLQELKGFNSVVKSMSLQYPCRKEI